MNTVIMNTKNSKTNELRKCALNLLQKLDLRSLKKLFAFQNLFIYYTCKNSTKIVNSK